MDQLIPMISQKVIESIKPTLKKMVDDSLLPHIEKIQSAHHVINLQREEIDKQNTIIQTLQDKLDKVEERVEEQEQYSRRTSLRFNNVRVPTNSNGDIIQPIDTDSIVLQICKNQLGVKRFNMSYLCLVRFSQMNILSLFPLSFFLLLKTIARCL
jgi:hypothetical protein